MGKEYTPRKKLKIELYKLLREPRTSTSAARIKVVCAELDRIPPQIITKTNKNGKGAN